MGGLRRIWPAVVLVLVAAPVTWAQASRDGLDEWERAVGSQDFYPVIDAEGPDGRYRMQAYVAADDEPTTVSVAYFSPGSGGGGRFPEVGGPLGWAFSVRTVGSLAYGVARDEVASVRLALADGDVLTIPTRRVEGLPLRVFSGFLAPDQRLAHDNLHGGHDAEGRLVGRLHTNDGRGGFGSWEGTWDQKAVERMGRIPTVPTTVAAPTS